ncbi:PAS domain-containing sensor histidine kinase [Chitinophaga sp. NPDC101104]|uniref:PAS domain-containing sensor histidine kinase n=1 Tax=Chitinophaga sp. NPDC101104 TaxID=3390561 RepID=UPI003D01C6D8
MPLQNNNTVIQQLEHQIIDSIPTAVYLTDHNGFILHFNPAAAKLWGREPSIGIDRYCGAYKAFQLDGRTPVDPDSCPMAICLRTGEPVQGQEIIIERPDGTRSYILPNPKPLFNEDGHLAGGINLITDLTAQRLQNESLTHLAAIVESSDDAIISKTLEGIITSWNKSAERIFGYKADEMIGKHISTLIPADRQDEEPAILRQLAAGKRVDHFETERVTSDGRIINISLTISPIRDASGTIIGASKIARDITSQKRGELLLRLGEERFRMAVSATKLGVWEVDLRTGVITCSDECRIILGLDIDSVADLQTLEALLHPVGNTRALLQLKALVEKNSGGDYDAVHRIVRPSDHKHRWVRVRGAYFHGRDGRPERLLGTLLDITPEKEAELHLERTVQQRTVELIKSNERLGKSNRDLEEFAYIASHDLQEPLRKIQTFIDMIRENPGDRQAFDKYFVKISDSARRMSTLIRDVLNYSRLSNAEGNPAETDLNEVLGDVLSDFESAITEKKATVITESLPVIIGEAAQLRQLFANLLGNALKFSTEMPEIRIHSQPITPTEAAIRFNLPDNRPYVQISVEDNGIGIEEQYVDKIFAIFKRLHNRQQYPGTGIGLAICKKIVENHHGHIFARRRPEGGTAMEVVLPLV